MKALPVQVCRACGGTLFMEAALHSFPDEASAARRGQPDSISVIPLSILICLCGTPLRPQVGGLHTGQIQAELDRFFASFDSLQAYRTSHADHARSCDKLTAKPTTQR